MTKLLSTENRKLLWQQFRGNLNAFRVFWPSWGLVVLIGLAMNMLPQGQDILQATSENYVHILVSGVALVFASFTVWYSARLYGFSQLEILSKGQWVSRKLLRFLAYYVYTVIILALSWLYIMNSDHPWLERVFQLVRDNNLFAVYALLLSIVSWLWYRFVFFVCVRTKIRLPFPISHNRLVFTVVMLIFFGVFLSAVIAEYFDGLLGMMLGLILSQTAMAVLMFKRFDWKGESRKKRQETWPFNSVGFLESGANWLDKYLDRWQDWLRKKIAYIMITFKDDQIEADFFRWMKLKKGKEDEPELLARLLVALEETCCLRGMKLWEFKKAMRSLGDNKYFMFFFALIAVFSAVMMAAANWSYEIATFGGPMTWLLIGLTGIMGTINLVRMIGRLYQARFLGLALTIIFFAGCLRDPHLVDLMPFNPSADQSYNFAEDRFGRLTFQEELDLWLSHRSDSTDHKRLVFVMGDGGAHRSGYWVAEVLEDLDRPGSPFGDEVFCFAGASGGSVGNATYYAALVNGITTPGACAEEITRQDYFSHTSARLLGHDMLNQFLPFFSDRGEGLEDAYAEAAAKVDPRINLELPIDSFICSKEEKWIPILTMGTTRMEDASPSLISTFRNSKYDNIPERPDVLSRMNDERTVRYASLGVLGARFPYLTPAGGIMLKEKGDYDYFVDGGYLDNSGAGIVLEMLMALESLKALNPGKYGGIVPLVIHLKNTSIGKEEEGTKHPLLNNLAAPILAIVGSYGEQTDVLNKRLQTYIEVTYPGERGYVSLNLLAGEKDKYRKQNLSYNWLMSERTRSFMEEQLDRKDIRLNINAICQELDR